MASVRGDGFRVPTGAKFRCMGPAGCGYHNGRSKKHWHYGKTALKSQAEGAKLQVNLKYVYFDNMARPTGKVRWTGFR